MLVIAKKSILRVKQAIKYITRRNAGQSLEMIITKLNEKLPGWVRYFKLAKCENSLRSLDEWMRRKLRCYKLKQLKRTATIARFFISRHIAEASAWKVASSGKGWWRKALSSPAHRAMGNGWLDQLGLTNMRKLYLSL